MSRDPATPRWRGWLVDIVAGSSIGGVVGLIAAWNLLIYLGVDRGYEASLEDAFGYSWLAGSLVVAVLAAGPSVGVWVARRLRRRRQARGQNESPPRSPAD